MERRVLQRSTSLLFIVAAKVFVCSEALAQANDDEKRIRAEALNREAAVEMAAGNYKSACPKFKQVVELVPGGIGAKMSLARCYEGWGRLASALKAYQLAELAAKAARDPRQTAARAKVVELETKVATLRVVVPIPVAALPGLEITLDGEVLGPAAWNKHMPIDRGNYVLRATAKGKQPWTIDVHISPDGFVASRTVQMLLDL
ncbi:tetratricopeptide repeat protein [Sorangium sp. So ce118]